MLCDNKEDIAAFDDFVVAENTATKTQAAAPSPVAPTPTPSPSAQSSSTPSNAGRVFASPIAKVNAAAKGIPLSQIQPTGPGGRVVKADVESYKAPVAASTSVAAPAPQTASGAAFADIPVSNIRKVIAQRLTQSKVSIPHYYLTVEVKMDKILKFAPLLPQTPSSLERPSKWRLQTVC